MRVAIQFFVSFVILRTFVVSFLRQRFTRDHAFQAVGWYRNRHHEEAKDAKGTKADRGLI